MNRDDLEYVVSVIGLIGAALVVWVVFNFFVSLIGVELTLLVFGVLMIGVWVLWLWIDSKD